MPVTVVGKATNVVKTDSFAIDECAGNVATKDDRMSLARVFVSQPGEEPWLTLGYDEWIYCCSGRLVFGLPDGSTVELKAGETALVDKGTRFQPRFPEAGTSYIPVCIPAFRPDRCVREEGSCSDVAKRLAALHTTKVEDAPEVLYHMVCFQCLSFCGTPSTRVPNAVRAAPLGGRQSIGRGLLPADLRRGGLHARDGRPFSPHRDGEPLLPGLRGALGLPALFSF